VRSKWFIGAIVVGLAAIVIAVVASKLKDNGDSDTLTTQEWADSVCTDVAAWKSSITSLADVSGGTLTKDALQQKLDDAKSATDELVSQLQDLGKPDLPAADELQQQLDSSADELKASYQSLQSQAQNALSADTPAAFLQGLAKLAPQFGQLLDQIKTTVDDLRSSDAAGSGKAELQQAFDDSASCQSLRSGNS
jgi:hypothetical protein